MPALWIGARNCHRKRVAIMNGLCMPNFATSTIRGDIQLLYKINILEIYPKLK